MEMAGQDYPTMFNSDKGVEVEFTLTKDLKMLSYVILQLVTVAGEQVMNLFQKRTLFIWMANSHMLLHHGEQIVDPTDYSILHQVIFEDGLSSSDLSRSNWCPRNYHQPCLYQFRKPECR